MSDDLTEQASQLGQLLLQKGVRVATAESCTGGWIAKLMTDIAGSSAWFDRGFVTYSNAAKQQMLGVREQTLADHGAVSEATVEEMAHGALAHSDATFSIAVSGIAGPGGGTLDKPVGTVWFAWAGHDGELTTEGCRFDGDRDQVRRQAVQRALSGLFEMAEY